MALSEFYGYTDEIEADKAINLAFEQGITHFDTADNYGYGQNEILLGRVIENFRENITIASKFGIVRDKNDPTARGVRGDKGYVKWSCDNSLKRLGVDYIDLYYLHRVDKNISLEETIEAMSLLVKEGKVRFIGISEATAEEIKKAHNIHPLTAIQSEYSIWTRSPEKAVLPVCQELGIAFVAYSPLGRGFLTGKFNQFTVFESSDYRGVMPRFRKDNLTHNIKLISQLQEIANKKYCSLAQLSLAWLFNKHSNVLPIFGTRTSEYVLGNIKAQQITLSPIEVKEIDAISESFSVKGQRYTEEVMKIYGFDE